MKKILLSITAFLLCITAFSQVDPVKWAFSAKKISTTVYEVYMTATINGGWHIYSQTQPADAIAIPTKFTFSKNNPLIKTDGSVKEVGKLEKFKDAKLGISANQYSKTVSFVQKISLVKPLKTNLTGSVQYQVCNDKECLPPKKVPFTINIG